MPVGMPEFVDNPEPRCPVILLCDTSGSMSGAPINNLNAGLAAFRQEVYKDEIASLRSSSCNLWPSAASPRVCHD